MRSCAAFREIFAFFDYSIALAGKKLRPVWEARKQGGVEGIWWTTFGKNDQIRQMTAVHQMWERELILSTATIFAELLTTFASDEDKILHLRSSA